MANPERSSIQSHNFTPFTNYFLQINIFNTDKFGLGVNLKDNGSQEQIVSLKIKLT